jgi:leucyl-tRNA synthetase
MFSAAGVPAAGVPAAGVPAAGRHHLSVFTTRPDTLWGATFLVMAPDHPEIHRWVAPDCREAFLCFQEECLEWKAPEEGNPANEVSAGSAGGTSGPIPGFFTGSMAVHPCTEEKIPVWVSPYVLSAYGEGAVMGVPAHDQRDFLFAHAHGLPIVQVVGPHGETPPPREPTEAFIEDGVLINSGSFSGLESAEARKRIVEWLGAAGSGKPSVEYRLHDWCISRQRYWGPPIPMIHCPGCGVVPVPEDQLPVLLPWIEDFLPDGSGVSPLARCPEFLHTACPACGGPAERDADVSDNFLDSSWYFLRYPSTDCETTVFDEGLTAKWLPVDMYVGGNEHAVLHLLYTRFVTMALYDLGIIPFEEPFRRFRAHGLLTHKGAKMSKSRGNVVNPDDYLDAYGADVFRAYVMFASNFQEGGDFRDRGITGIVRFYDRVWRYMTTADFSSAEVADREYLSAMHGTIKKVTEDIERLHYNTALAALMEFFNTMASRKLWCRAAAKAFLQLLAPFAPCLCHELWERIGEDGMIHAAPWPRFDESKIHVQTVEYVFQVDGKIRARLQLPAGMGREEVEKLAQTEPAVKRHLGSRGISRIFFVPDKLVNIVSGSSADRGSGGA